MDSTNTITVAFAEDHIAVRKSIISFIELKNPEISVVIEADDGIELLKELERADHLPDICILDIKMPRMEGYTVLVQIRHKWPSVKCLILTAFDDELMILRMLKAGANGYLLKNCKPDEIGDALRDIQLTGYHYSNAASHRIFSIVERKGNKIVQDFTEIELELIRHSTTGMSYFDMSEKMKITEKSLEGHRLRLYAKLNINNRSELALFAFQSGITPLGNDK